MKKIPVSNNSLKSSSTTGVGSAAVNLNMANQIFQNSQNNHLSRSDRFIQNGSQNNISIYNNNNKHNIKGETHNVYNKYSEFKDPNPLNYNIYNPNIGTNNNFNNSANMNPINNIRNSAMVNFMGTNNVNEYSSIFSENNIIPKINCNENQLSINKSEYLSLMEKNKNEYNTLGIDVENDKNIQNLKENNNKFMNSDLSILHSDLFLYTKFENSRPYKMIDYIMNTSDSPSIVMNNNSQTANINSNNNIINKNFLKSKLDKDIYEEIKKTIFNKPKCHLSENRTSVQKALFQYIKSDFTNSHIIKIFEKCNSTLQKILKQEDNSNSKDKFTYQNILIEKLKDNYNNDLLYEINDTDMLRSLIYIVNKNYKFWSTKIKKATNSNNNNNKEKSNRDTITDIGAIDNKMTLVDSIFNNWNINVNNINHPNNTNLNGNQQLYKTLSNNFNFIKSVSSDILSNQSKHPSMTLGTNSVHKTRLNLLRRIKNILFFPNRKENNWNINANRTSREDTKSCNEINKSDTKLKEACDNINNDNDTVIININSINNDPNIIKNPNLLSNSNNLFNFHTAKLNNQDSDNNKNEINTISNEASKKLKKFIYKKLQFIIKDKDNKNVALIKMLKNKEQNLRLFCKLIELFSKCREDDFEKIYKKIKKYLSTVDLDLAENVDEILKSLNLEKESLHNILSEKDEINKNIVNSNNAELPNENACNPNKDKFENISDGEIDQNPKLKIVDKKIQRNKLLNDKNILVKSLLDIKSFWIIFRVFFSLNNVNYIQNTNCEYLSDEKYWGIIFNYLVNKDYKLLKAKIKTAKLKKHNKDTTLNQSELKNSYNDEYNTNNSARMKTDVANELQAYNINVDNSNDNNTSLNVKINSNTNAFAEASIKPAKRKYNKTNKYSKYNKPIEPQLNDIKITFTKDNKGKNVEEEKNNLEINNGKKLYI